MYFLYIYSFIRDRTVILSPESPKGVGTKGVRNGVQNAWFYCVGWAGIGCRINATKDPSKTIALFPCSLRSGCPKLRSCSFSKRSYQTMFVRRGFWSYVFQHSNVCFGCTNNSVRGYSFYPSVHGHWRGGQPPKPGLLNNNIGRKYIQMV